MADVPEHLRTFARGWLEVAAQGPDGYDEALAAGHAWLRDRRAWREAHGYRGSVLPGCGLITPSATTCGERRRSGDPRASAG